MNKLRDILSFPLTRFFKYKLVLKITVRSIAILFSLFSFAWISEYFFYDLYQILKPLIYVLKDTLYMVIALLPLAYFISKYKFCATTLVSFYMVVFLRVFWMINTHVVAITCYKEITISIIFIAWLVIVIDRIKAK